MKTRKEMVEAMVAVGKTTAKYWSTVKLTAEYKALVASQKPAVRTRSEAVKASWEARKALYGKSGLSSTAFRSDVVRRAWVSRKANVAVAEA